MKIDKLSRRIVNDSVTSYYVDGDRTGGGEDLIIWVYAEPLCCVFEPNIRLYINRV